MKYTFTPKEPMSAYQQRQLLVFLIKFLIKRFNIELDDKVEKLPDPIKQHFTKK